MTFEFPSLDGNPYFSAGFGLTVLGTLLAIAKRAAFTSMIQARKAFTVTMEITSKDRSYPWVLQWLNTKAGASPMGQHISVETTVTQSANGSMATMFDFLPSPGTHIVKYKTRWLIVERKREKNMVDLQSGSPWETVKLTTLGRDMNYFRQFLNDAREAAAEKQEAMTLVYTNWGTEWRQFGPPRRKRPLDSVVLGKGIKEKIVNDINSFINSSKWYVDRGIPYRRGYLLHGTPGSGKSSFIMALAGHINYNICIVNLNERGLTDDRLAHSLSILPTQSIVLLEDIDAAFLSNRNVNDKYGTGVTFSGLLNTLDGVVAGEERLVFMTTNHIERLDQALIRPGRVDVIHRLGPASSDQARQLFLKFFPDQSELAKDFIASIQGYRLSMAALQGHFMIYRDQPLNAINEVPLFLKDLIQQQQVLEKKQN